VEFGLGMLYSFIKHEMGQSWELGCCTALFSMGWGGVWTRDVALLCQAWDGVEFGLGMLYCFVKHGMGCH
jgi:hypothetical protein